MFGIKHPIISAAMGPLYTKELALAVSEAGGLGVVGEHTSIGGSSVKFMRESLKFVAEHTDKPFGFNIRTSRNELEAEAMCRRIPKIIMQDPKLREQVVYALTSAGSPRMLGQSQNFQKLKKATEINHFHVGPALWLVDKCIDSGVDGLVCTGTEGAGHQSYERVSTLVLLQQVRKKYPDVPLIGCGGFATGEGLAAAISMGAGAVAMGTRFVASKESDFPQNFKDIVPPANAEDTVLVTGTFGPIRLWKNKYSLSHGFMSRDERIAYEKTRTNQDLVEEGKPYYAIFDGEMENAAYLLGQSAGLINRIEHVKDIVETIVKDAENCLRKAYTTVF